MSRSNQAAPIIIKRKRVVVAGGHHGGAWKVAYADFVTAMMAFFLMMWLLGATTETQRQGLADFFSPTVQVMRDTSGGEQMLSGEALTTQRSTGPADPVPTADTAEGSASVAESLAEIRERLAGLGGESRLMDAALRHVVTRLTDEGLVIEIFDLPGAPLFAPESEQPEPVLEIIAGILGSVLPMTANPVAIGGHVRSYTVLMAADPRWPLSINRAGAFRRLLEEQGFDPARVHRVTGHADRRPALENSMSERNNRLEVVVLREGRF